MRLTTMLLSLVFLNVQALSQQGYLIVLKNEIHPVKCKEIVLQDSLPNWLQQHHIKIVPDFTNTPFIEYNSTDVYFYIEKGTITKKKNGILRFKRSQERKTQNSPDNNQPT